MSGIHKRFMKFAVSASILGAGILPGSCATQIRTAAVDGFAAFVGDAVDALLAALIPLDTLLGAASGGV